MKRVITLVTTKKIYDFPDSMSDSEILEKIDEKSIDSVEFLDSVEISKEFLNENVITIKSINSDQ